MFGLQIIKSVKTYWSGNKLMAEIDVAKNQIECRLQGYLDDALVAEVIRNLSKELALTIKDKLLEDKEFSKILSEVRLEIVKKILN